MFNFRASEREGWSRLTRVPTGEALDRATIAIMSMTEALGRLGVARGLGSGVMGGVLFLHLV